jgi:alkaline phosphatase
MSLVPRAAAVALVAALALAPLRPAAAGENPWRAQGRAAVAQSLALVGRPLGRAKNVILFLGDGMGPSTVTAARIYDGQLHGHPGEENLLAFETFPYVALSKTYSVNAQVAESAATMTAIMTGVKTKEDVIGLDETAIPNDFRSAARSRVRSLLEDAEERGLATGVVTTTRVTHATPAATYAHVPQRDWEDDSMLPPDARAAGFPDIARQLVEFPYGDGVDVVLGGGRAEFLPRTARDPEHPEVTGDRSDGRDLIAAWRARHPDGSWVWSRSQFQQLDAQTAGPVLGLFEPSHMLFESERATDVAGEPSLSEMTGKAIELLSRDPDGYFLMVEGGRIDHAHHQGNAYRALTETVEFSNAVRAALERVDLANTLVIVTADHSHVLTISGYPTRGNPILGVVHGNLPNGEPSPEPLRDMLGLPFTTLSYANGPGYTGASPQQPEGSKHYPHDPTAYRGIRRGRPLVDEAEATDPSYLQESTVPTRVDTHGGEDVAIYATGAGAQLFHGVQEESYVYHAMRAALGWRESPDEHPAPAPASAASGPDREPAPAAHAPDGATATGRPPDASP